MADVDILGTLAVLLAAALTAWFYWLTRQAVRHQQELRNRPPRNELADLDSFITRLNEAASDEEVSQLEQERNRQWPNSSSLLSSG